MTSLRGIAAALESEGLRPIVDNDLNLVRAECPECRAGAADPDRLYRPLVVIPRGRRTRVVCEACGGSSHV